MAISNVNTANSFTVKAFSPTSVTDSESRNIQNQITNAQQRLNKLSSDSEISQEEKAKKRQEIQKQIAELNRKLRQRRMEQKEEAAEAAEKQEKQKQLQESMLSEKPSDTPSVPVKDMLTADSKLRQQQVLENTAKEKDGQANVLESEIKSDAIYGTDTTAKKEKLSDMRRELPLEIESIPRPEAKDPFTTDINAKIIIRDK